MKRSQNSRVIRRESKRKHLNTRQKFYRFRHHVRYLAVDDMIILKQILKIPSVSVWAAITCLRR
jgi:hypothetical protein